MNAQNRELEKEDKNKRYGAECSSQLAQAFIESQHHTRPKMLRAALPPPEGSIYAPHNRQLARSLFARRYAGSSGGLQSDAAVLLTKKAAYSACRRRGVRKTASDTHITSHVPQLYHGSKPLPHPQTIWYTEAGVHYISRPLPGGEFSTHVLSHTRSPCISFYLKTGRSILAQPHSVRQPPPPSKTRIQHGTAPPGVNCEREGCSTTVASRIPSVP